MYEKEITVMKDRIKVFFENTIDIFILWLEECVKPFLDVKKDISTYKEQLDEPLQGTPVTVKVDNPNSNIIPFPLNTNFFNINDDVIDNDWPNIVDSETFQNLVDEVTAGMGEEVKYSEGTDDMDNDLDFNADRVVFISLPWGQIVPIPFSGDQWKMVYEISQESGDPMHKVVEDTIQQRFELATDITDDYMNKNVFGGRDIDDQTDTDE